MRLVQCDALGCQEFSLVDAARDGSDVLGPGWLIVHEFRDSVRSKNFMAMMRDIGQISQTPDLGDQAARALISNADLSEMHVRHLCPKHSAVVRNMLHPDEIEVEEDPGQISFDGPPTPKQPTKFELLLEQTRDRVHALTEQICARGDLPHLVPKGEQGEYQICSDQFNVRADVVRDLLGPSVRWTVTYVGDRHQTDNAISVLKNAYGIWEGRDIQEWLAAEAELTLAEEQAALSLPSTHQDHQHTQALGEPNLILPQNHLQHAVLTRVRDKILELNRLHPYRNHPHPWQVQPALYSGAGSGFTVYAEVRLDSGREASWAVRSVGDATRAAEVIFRWEGVWGIHDRRSIQQWLDDDVAPIEGTAP